MHLEDWRFDYSIEQMSIQRHDFMNYLQVIYGYIQVNKPDEAIKYIKQINNKIAVLSMVFNIECPDLSVVLQDFIYFCSKYGIEVEFNSDLECISMPVISKNKDEVKKYFDYIKSNFQESIIKKKKLIHINLYGEIEDFKIVITNDESLIYYGVEDHSEKADNLNGNCKIFSYFGDDVFAIMLEVN